MASSTTPPSGPDQHHILLLNAPFVPGPFSFPHTLTQLLDTDPVSIQPHLSQATIIVTAAVRFTPTDITTRCPRLRVVICMGTGVDLIPLPACRERGITVCNTPAQNVESVAEHALALFMAFKRKVVDLHRLTLDGTSWRERTWLNGEWGSPPRTNRDEIVGVVGYGALGKGVERVMGGNGMRVLVAERKGLVEAREGRVGFREVMERCTVLVLCAPLDDGTKGMVGEEELKLMREDAVLVNVGRGGIVDEEALVRALKEGWIGGAATDVFEREPATKENSPLLREGTPNLLLSPHIAWFSKTSIEGAKNMVHDNVEMFVNGTPQNVIV